MSLSFLIKATLKALALPPGSILVLIVLGLALGRWRRRAGAALVGLAALVLLIASLPVIADAAIGTLVRHAPLDPAAAGQAGAIVILGGGVTADAPEYAAPVLTGSSVARCLYGAKLHRDTGLPILVTGGDPLGIGLTDGEAMRQFLSNDLGIAVRWVETASRDTEENATLSRRMLAGISRIVLVTHATHMPRAEQAFRRAGFEVVPAPTGFPIVGRFRVTDLLPGAGALRRNAAVLREWIGMLWLAVRPVTP